MKQFAFLGILFLFLSCSLDNDSPSFHYELLETVSVEMPDEFQMGETYAIKVRYNRPSTCHSPGGFYYEKNLNTRIIAVQNIVTEKDNCLPLTNELVEETFDFYVTHNGSYVFKFWQGKNANNEDVFLEMEVPVVD